MNRFFQGDAVEVLKTLPTDSVDCIVTSPPYWALRDYGVDGQLGLEPTFNEYIQKLCDVFDEGKRVLKKSGSCWVNLGDTYYGGGFGIDTDLENTKQATNEGTMERQETLQLLRKNLNKNYQEKCLTLVPFRFAIEMVNRGWILRNTIIWQKPNVMPSSVKDRFTVDFEYLFFFTKSKRYYFERQFDPHADVSIRRAEFEQRRVAKGQDPSAFGKSAMYGMPARVLQLSPKGHNRRTVWSIPIGSYEGAHFAVYPERLIETPIKAGCPDLVCIKCGAAKAKSIKTKSDSSFNIRVRDVQKGRIKHLDRVASIEEVESYDEKTYSPDKDRIIKIAEGCTCNAGFSGGVVLDPFVGSGTTCLVAQKLGRNWIGIDLNPKYIEMAKKRLEPFMAEKLTDFEVSKK